MIMFFSSKQCCLNVIVVCIFVTNSYKYTLFISKRFMLDEMTQNFAIFLEYKKNHHQCSFFSFYVAVFSPPKKYPLSTYLRKQRGYSKTMVKFHQAQNSYFRRVIYYICIHQMFSCSNDPINNLPTCITSST